MEKQWKQCQTLFLGGSKITVDGGCGHGIKRHLLLRRKVMTNLDSILKSWDIALLTKARLVKAMVFPVVMYGCETWIIKKAECQRIDVFKMWCWRRLLRVPWTVRSSNQSILKEISPEYFYHPQKETLSPFVVTPYSSIPTHSDILFVHLKNEVIFYYWIVRVPYNFWTVVLEKTLESPLDCKEMKPANPKGNQS